MTHAAVFLAGAGIMALEILASRWMAPGLGFTIATWAFLISATLLGGAVGAAWGGRLARAASWRRVGGLLAGAGAWMGTLAFAAPRLVDALDSVSVIAGAAVASGTLIGPPVVLLAAVLPLTTELARRREAAGSTVGRLLALSTLGSLAGTLVAAFVFVPVTGLEAGALLTGGLLGAVGLAAAGWRRGAGAALGAAILIGVLVAPHAPDAPDATLRRATPYGLLTLAPAPGGGWTLAVDGIAQATVSPWSTGVGALLQRRQYVELLPHLRPLGRRALQVGLGGGLLNATFETYGIDVESIEVNPGVVDVLRRRFGFDGRVHVGDGRAVWRRLRARYDFVVLDAFQGEALPAHLLTREAMREVHARLAPGGVVCVHLIGAPRHEAVGAVAATLGAEFDHVRCARGGLADELQDLFLFASDRPLRLPPDPALVRFGWLGNEWFAPNEKGAPVLTDDRNPLESLHEPLARALRRASRLR